MRAAATSATPGRLFAYGTLMFPEVFHAVTGAVRTSKAASISDYARYRVRGHNFPGLVPQRGGRVDGRLLEAIDPPLWALLDTFESDFYARVAVTVRRDDGRRLAAQTYVVVASERGLLEDRDWSVDEFRRHHIGAYLASAR